ncbi:MAG: hypothetical protein V1816_16695, partial [Pseudomonadota bacterium]
MKNGFSTFSGIRARIIILAASGVLGMVFLAVINQYLGSSRSRGQELVQCGRELAVGVTQMVRLEEKFTYTNDRSILEERDLQSQALAQAISRAQSLAASEEIAQLVEKSLHSRKKHEAVFQEIAESLALMKNSQ